MSLRPNPWVGRSVRRREDGRLLCGAGRYTADLAGPDALHLAFVRSPHAHAALGRIDVSAARRAPGVAGVFTAPDLDLEPITARFTGAGYAGAGWPPLAAGRIRFVGDPVAVVAAASRYLAEDAADLVEVTYDPLPPVPDAQTALAPEAPRLHEGVPGNVYFRREHRHGDVDRAFEQAAVVVRAEIAHQRLAAVPMEGRGLVAEPDPAGRLVVWASTQTPHLLRTALARSLRLPEAAVRVVAPDVGGGFGPKMHVYPEDVVAAALALRLRRRVVWVEDRRENLLTMTQAREQRVAAALAADADGRLLGLRATVVCDSGAYSVYPLTAALEPMGTVQIMPGPYRVPAYAYTTAAVATTKPPVGAYRGVGMTVGVLVMERLMDRLARALALDPAEVRRRNFIPADAFPHAAPTGLVYDSGRYEATLDAALAVFRYDEARAERDRLRRAGRLVGVGLATFVEYTGMGPQTFERRGMADAPGRDSAAVRVEPSGAVRVAVSCPSQGQGQETVYAQLVAGELGVRLDQVTVAAVDTDGTPAGSGTFASRSVVVGGGAAVRAAEQVRRRAAEVAADLLEASADDIEAGDGRLFVRGSPERSVAWQDVAAAASGLEATATYEPPPAAFSNGAHAAMVEVDPGTGQVAILRYAVAEDCGPVVNPMLVEGQTHGGLAQGLGEALLEDAGYDAGGQPLAATLMDYLLPTAMEVPPVAIAHLETPSPNTVRGFKGMGESATIGAPACLANALSDALGREVDSLPASPDRLLALLRGRAAERAPGPGARSAVAGGDVSRG